MENRECILHTLYIIQNIEMYVIYEIWNIKYKIQKKKIYIYIKYMNTKKYKMEYLINN